MCGLAEKRIAGERKLAGDGRSLVETTLLLTTTHFGVHLGKAMPDGFGGAS
jgi:hypothetical protein